MSNIENKQQESSEIQQNTPKKNKKLSKGAMIAIIVALAAILFLAIWYVWFNNGILKESDGVGKDQKISLNDVNMPEINFENVSAVSASNIKGDAIQDIESFQKYMEENRKTSDGKVVEFVPIRNMFDLASSNVSNCDLINEFAKNYLQTDKTATILVEGYACDLGDDTSNMKLSKDRAIAVKNVLVECGVAEDKIEMKWYGESRYNELGYPSKEDHRRVNVSIK